MQHFTSIKDVLDLSALVKTAAAFKKDSFAMPDLGKQKTLGMLFFNSSLRTRLSTQKAAQNLGMQVIVMNVGTDGWALETEEGVIMNQGKAEHIKEAAAVIGQYCDILGVRSFANLKNQKEDYEEKVLQNFIKYAGVPVVSLESATLHPLQSLTDLLTINLNKKIEKPKVVLTWAPHPKALPQAVANSFSEWMLKSEVEFVITHPKGYELSKNFTEGAIITNNQDEAFKNADFIYAKNWSAYNDYGKILSQDENWMITKEKMALTNEAFFMHCLPVRRNVIVSDDVIDNDKSLVIEQAGNREFAAQAVLKEMVIKL